MRGSSASEWNTLDHDERRPSRHESSKAEACRLEKPLVLRPASHLTAGHRRHVQIHPDRVRRIARQRRHHSLDEDHPAIGPRLSAAVLEQGHAARSGQSCSMLFMTYASASAGTPSKKFPSATRQRPARPCDSTYDLAPVATWACSAVSPSSRDKPRESRQKRTMPSSHIAEHPERREIVSLHDRCRRARRLRVEVRVEPLAERHVPLPVLPRVHSENMRERRLTRHRAVDKAAPRHHVLLPADKGMIPERAFRSRPQHLPAAWSTRTAPLPQGTFRGPPSRAEFDTAQAHAPPSSPPVPRSSSAHWPVGPPNRVSRPRTGGRCPDNR